MKVAVITDTHFGVRSESPAFMRMMSDFFKSQFFPLLKREGISRILHLGDLVDRRKYVAFSTARTLREAFVEPLLSGDYELDIIVGNHDLPLKNMASLNAQRELLPINSRIRVYDQPTHIIIDGLKILMLPWICRENEKQTMEMLETSDAHLCLGHLELNGFEQYRGMVATEGFDHTKLARFPIVASGHYHHQSSRDNVVYLGAPYEMNWNDFNDARGFHILDTDKLTFNFVQNHNVMHKKLYYDDNKLNEDFSEYEGKMVKLIIKSKSDPVLYDRWVENLMQAKPLNVEVVDDHMKKDAVSDGETAGEVEDMLSMLMGCVDEYGVGCDKEELRSLLVDLYQRASEFQA